MQSNNNPTSSNTPANNVPNGASNEQSNRSYTPKPSREPGNGSDNVDSYDQGPGSGGRYGGPYTRDFRDRDDRGRSRFTGSFNSYRRPSRPRDELSPPPAKRRKLEGDDPDLPPFKRYDDSPPYYNNNRYNNHYNSYDRQSDFNNKDRYLSNSGPPSRPYNSYNNGPDKPFYQRDRNFREDYRGPRQNFGNKRFFRGGGPHKMGRGGSWYQNRDDRHEGGGYRDNSYERRDRWAPRGGRYDDNRGGWDRDNYRNENKDRWNNYNPRFRRDDRDNNDTGRESPRGRRLSTSRSRSRSLSRSRSRSRSYSPSSPNSPKYAPTSPPIPSRSRSVSPVPVNDKGYAPTSPVYPRAATPPPRDRLENRYAPTSPRFYSPTSAASTSPYTATSPPPGGYAPTSPIYASNNSRPVDTKRTSPPLYAPTSPIYTRERERSPPPREQSPPRPRDRAPLPVRDRSPPPRDTSPPPRDRSPPPYVRDRSPPPRGRSPFNRDRSPPPRDRSPRYSPPRYSRSPSPRGRSPNRDRSPLAPRDRSPLPRHESSFFGRYRERSFQPRDRRSRSNSPPPRSPPYSPRGRYAPRNMPAPRPMKPVPTNSLSNSGPSPSPSPGLPEASKSNSSSQKTPTASPVKPVNPSPIKPPMSSPVQASPSFSRGAASTLRHTVAGSHPAAPANGKSARRDMILIEIDNKDNEIMKAMKELEDLKKEKDRLFKFLATKREQLEAEMKKANEPKETTEEDKKVPTQSAEELQKAAEQEEKRLRDTVTEQSKFVQMDMDASKPLFERITEYNKKMASSALDPLKKLFPFETPKAIFQGKELAVTFKHISELPFIEENFKVCQKLRPSLIRIRQKRVVDARERERKIRDKYVNLVHKWKRRLQQQRQLRRQQKLEEEIKKQAAADREGKGRGRVIGRRLTLRSSAKAINSKDMPAQIDLGEEGESYQYNAQEEKLRRLQEKKDFESRFLRTLAFVPAMIVDPDRKKLKFIDNNRLVEDSVAAYKEYRSKHLWSEEEEEIFVKYYLKYPKDFVRIASYLPNKSTKDVIYYYYNNKMRLNLKERARFEDEERRRSDPTRGRYLDETEIHTFGTSVDWVNGSSRRGSIRLSDKPAVNYSERTALPVMTPPPPMDRRRLDIPERPSSAPGPDEATRWSEAEKELFKIHFVKHLKDFKAISDEIKTKNIAQVKNFYHNNKRKLGLDKILMDATNAQTAAEKAAEKAAAQQAQQQQQQAVARATPPPPVVPTAIPTSSTPPPMAGAAKGRRGRPRNTSKSVTPTNTAPSAFAMPTGPTAAAATPQPSQQSNLNVVLPTSAPPQTQTQTQSPTTSPPVQRAATPVVKESTSPLIQPMKGPSSKDILTSSHWTDGEKQMFLQYLGVHGKNWKMLSDLIPTKTVNQIKNYYQNYRNKLNLDDLLPESDRNAGRGRGKKRGNLSRPRGRPRKPKDEESGASTLASLDAPARRSRISSLLNDNDTLEDIRASDLRGHDDDEDSMLDDNYEDDDDGGDIMDVDYSENSIIENETSQDVKSYNNTNDERSERDVITNENTNTSINNTNSNAAFADQMDTSDSVAHAQPKQVEPIVDTSSQPRSEDKPQEKHEQQHSEAKSEHVEEKSQHESQPEPVVAKAEPTVVAEPVPEVKHEPVPEKSVEEHSSSAKMTEDVEMSEAPEDQPAQAEQPKQEAEVPAQEKPASETSDVHEHHSEESNQPSVSEHQSEVPADNTSAPLVAVNEPEAEKDDSAASVPNAPVQESNEGKADAESVYDPTEPTDDAQ